MSLSEVTNLTRDWVSEGLKWTWSFNPRMKPFVIPAQDEVQLPEEKFVYQAPEGVLIHYGAYFDHPACGVRVVLDPHADSGTVFTVNNFASAGYQNMVLPVTSLVPPQTPQGVYLITWLKEWAWTEWCKVYVINTDNYDHTCIGFGYTINMLREKRPLNAERLKLYMELFPKVKSALQSKLRSEAISYLREMGIDL